MIVTLRTADGHPEPSSHGRVNAIQHVFDAVLLFDDAGFVVRHVVAIKAGCDPLRHGCIREKISSELFDGELVIGHVGVEGLDDPVPPQPNLTGLVAKISVGVGVAGGVEPVDRHAFAKVRGREQAVDSPFVAVLLKSLNFVPCRREPGQVKVDTAQKSFRIRCGRKSESCALQAGGNKRIDRIQGSVDFGHQWLDDWFERPMLLVSGPLGNPRSQRFDLRGGELLVCTRRRHPQTLILSRDAGQQFALLRLAGHDRREARIGWSESSLTHIKS